jgi:ABC-type long-subunit fatty acid transport system fused permease/ATPase subunit
LSIAVSITIIVFGVRQYRSEQNELMSFNEGFLVALGIAILGIVISSIGQYIYSNLIDPMLYETMADQMTTMLEKYNAPEAEITKATEQIKNMGTMEGLGLQLLKSAAMMAVIAAIIAAVMKKQPSNPFNNKTSDQL